MIPQPLEFPRSLHPYEKRKIKHTPSSESSQLKSAISDGLGVEEDDGEE